MCNYRGELSECSQANFFLVRDRVVLTPPSEAGLLEGITRAFIFEVGKDAGIEVREAVLHPKDLETADEAFITSTTRELSPVTRIDGKPVGTGTVGAITKQLLEGYRRRAQELTTKVSIADR
jgi:branched-chain amino acid aminotransferase